MLCVYATNEEIFTTIYAVIVLCIYSQAASSEFYVSLTKKYLSRKLDINRGGEWMSL
jgi:hypothetical protein